MVEGETSYPAANCKAIWNLPHAISEIDSLYILAEISFGFRAIRRFTLLMKVIKSSADFFSPLDLQESIELLAGGDLLSCIVLTQRR